PLLPPPTVTPPARPFDNARPPPPDRGGGRRPNSLPPLPPCPPPPGGAPRARPGRGPAPDPPPPVPRWAGGQSTSLARRDTPRRAVGAARGCDSMGVPDDRHSSDPGGREGRYPRLGRGDSYPYVDALAGWREPDGRGRELRA